MQATRNELRRATTSGAVSQIQFDGDCELLQLLQSVEGLSNFIQSSKRIGHLSHLDQLWHR